MLTLPALHIFQDDDEGCAGFAPLDATDFTWRLVAPNGDLVEEWELPGWWWSIDTRPAHIRATYRYMPRTDLCALQQSEQLERQMWEALHFCHYQSLLQYVP